MLQTDKHLRGRQRAAPGGGEFQSQRQTFQTVAQRGDGGRVARRQAEIGPDFLSAGDKQADAGNGGQGFERAGQKGNGKRRQGKFAFALHAQPLTGSRQNGQRRRIPEQGFHHVRPADIGQLFQVV